MTGSEHRPAPGSGAEEVAGIRIALVPARAVRPLQQAVLRPDGPLATDRPTPRTWLHLAARYGTEVVGAASCGPAPWPLSQVMPLEPPVWQLRSLAVAAEFRRRGIATALLAVAAREARAAGVVWLWADARCSALHLYSAAGWRAVGPEWDKPGVGPHRRVVRST